MLACSECRERLGKVMLMSTYYHHHLNRIIIQDLIVVRTTVGSAKTLCVRFSAGATGGVNGPQICERNLFKVWQVYPASQVAGANKSNTQIAAALFSSASKGLSLWCEGQLSLRPGRILQQHRHAVRRRIHYRLVGCWRLLKFELVRD